MTDEVFTLYDDSYRFFEAKARGFLAHIKQMNRRIVNGEITTWEKNRLLKMIEKEEQNIIYWTKMAKNHVPKF